LFMVAGHLSSQHKRYLFYSRGPLKQSAPNIGLYL
jgi:hypothetical protein